MTILEKIEERGIERGRLEEKKEIARNFLREGTGISLVSKATGLSIAEVEQLNNTILPQPPYNISYYQVAFIMPFHLFRYNSAQ